jgi:hypothetical protein
MKFLHIFHCWHNGVTKGKDVIICCNCRKIEENKK